MPSAIQPPGTILRYRTRHDFTRRIEDPDTAPAWRDAIRTGNVPIVVEGRRFNVQVLANKVRFNDIDAPPLTLWQRFVRLIAGDRLRAHLENAIDRTGAPTFMGPVAKWSERDATALREQVQSHRAILNYPLPEGHDAALYATLYHLKFHARGIDRPGAELLFRQKLFNAEGLNLRRSMLKGIDLSGRNLQRTIFNESNLNGADLSRADLRGARLRGAQLRGAILARAQLQGADLRGADLREVDLRGLDLTNAYLQGAKLRGAKLEGTTLRLGILLALIDQGVDVRGARMQWTFPRETPNAGKHLRKLIRAGVDLRGADLRGLNLRGCKFRPTNLEGADLRDAVLHYADLRSVKLPGVDLRGANLARVRLGHQTLFGARLDRTALSSLKKPPLTRGIPGMEKQEAEELAGVAAYLNTYPEAAQEAALDAKYPPHLPHDLSGVDLREADLRDFDFGLVSLTRANLQGANLMGANLDRAILTDANLQGTILDGGMPESSHADRIDPDAALAHITLSDNTLPGNTSLDNSPPASTKLEDAPSDGADGASLPDHALERTVREETTPPTKTTRGSDAVDPAAFATPWGDVTIGGDPWIATPGEPEAIIATPVTQPVIVY